MTILKMEEILFNSIKLKSQKVISEWEATIIFFSKKSDTKTKSTAEDET